MTITNNIIRKIDVIRTTPEIELGIRSVFNCAYVNGAKYNNFYFEDIQITDSVS